MHQHFVHYKLNQFLSVKIYSSILKLLEYVESQHKRRSVKVGRGSWCDVVCSADAYVSREHCAIDIIRGHFDYVHVTSGGPCYYNGTTYVNGEAFNFKNGTSFQLVRGEGEVEKIEIIKKMGWSTILRGMNPRINYMSTATMDQEVGCQVDNCDYKSSVMMLYNRHCATHYMEYEAITEPYPDIVASYQNGRIKIRYELSEFCFSYCTGNNLEFIARCLKRGLTRKNWSTTATVGYYEREAYRLEINRSIWLQMEDVLSLCCAKKSSVAELCDSWYQFVQSNVEKMVRNEDVVKRLSLRRKDENMTYANTDMLCYMISCSEQREEKKPSALYVGLCDGDVGNRLLRHRYCCISEATDIVNGGGMRACVVARIEFKGRNDKNLDRELLEYVEELTRRHLKEKGKIDVRNKEREVANCACSFCVSELRILVVCFFFFHSFIFT